MRLLKRIANRIGSNLFCKPENRAPLPTSYTEEWIRTSSGAKLYSHTHYPQAAGKYPGIVFVPGGLSAGTDYDKHTEVTADDVASLGFVVLHYDPSGRARSEGEEDYWGSRHQQELLPIVQCLARNSKIAVEKSGIGIISFSIGITIATGFLAANPLPFIRYLFDWEGPSNRFNITKNDTHEPLKAFPTSNLDFWREREPCRFIGQIRCGYFRYQAWRDHMQGTMKEHAVELVNLATLGQAKWTRLNDNPLNMLVGQEMIEPRWVPWYRNHKGQILKYLLDVSSME